MITLCPAQPRERQIWTIGTDFISSEGKANAVRLVSEGTWSRNAAAPADYPLEERLAQALSAARRAVQNQTRYLGINGVETLTRNLSALLTVDAWDDDDEILNPESVTTLIQVTMALDLGLPGLTLARNGNLIGTWSMDDHVLRVEGHVDRTTAWTLLYPRGAAPRHQHHACDSLDNLVAVVGKILGRPGGRPG